MAAALAALGETGAAFEWLERACRGRDKWVGWLQVDPRFATMRQDPRMRDARELSGFAADS